MKTNMKRLDLVSFLCLFGLLASAANAKPSNELTENLSKMRALSGVEYHRVESKTIDRGFDVFVKTPASDKSQNKKYPTIYLLDGDLTFPLLAGYQSYLRLADEVPELVMVGISYGSNELQNVNFRGTDYTAPATSRAHYGGASKFQEFLRVELIPFIEATYPSDPDQRIIFGQSLGGQFVIYSAQTDPDLFWGHIASNPALHRNLDFFLPEELPIAKEFGKLFVANGTNNDQRFQEPATEWMTYWRERKEDLPWELKTMDLVGDTHMSAAPNSYREGLQWLFSMEID